MLKKLSIKSIAIMSLALLFIMAIALSMFISFTVKNVLTTSLIDSGKLEIASLVRTQANTHLPPEIFSELDLSKTQNTFDLFFKEINMMDKLLRIKVWDKNARIIASNDPDIVGMSFPDNKMFQKAIKSEVAVEIKAPVEPDNIKEKGYAQLMEVYVPITYDGDEVLGIVEVYVILDNLNKQISKAQSEILFKLIITLVILLVFVSGMFLLFYRSIIRKIHVLIEHTRLIGGGNLSEKIDITANDEISEIAVAINKMSDNLRVSLISKNELEKQIKDRTLELQLKMDEVEKMNKLITDRELKMIELKKEIANLKGLTEYTNKQ